jgi:hypothetical protein
LKFYQELNLIKRGRKKLQEIYRVGLGEALLQTFLVALIQSLMPEHRCPLLRVRESKDSQGWYRTLFHPECALMTSHCSKLKEHYLYEDSRRKHDQNDKSGTMHCVALSFL